MHQTWQFICLFQLQTHCLTCCILAFQSLLILLVLILIKFLFFATPLPAYRTYFHKFDINCDSLYYLVVHSSFWQITNFEIPIFQLGFLVLMDLDRLFGDYFLLKFHKMQDVNYCLTKCSYLFLFLIVSRWLCFFSPKHLAPFQQIFAFFLAFWLKVIQSSSWSILLKKQSFIICNFG